MKLLRPAMKFKLQSKCKWTWLTQWGLCKIFALPWLFQVHLCFNMVFPWLYFLLLCPSQTCWLKSPYWLCMNTLLLALRSPNFTLHVEHNALSSLFHTAIDPFINSWYSPKSMSFSKAEMVAYSPYINGEPSAHEIGMCETFSKWMLNGWKKKWINGHQFIHL